MLLRIFLIGVLIFVVFKFASLAFRFLRWYRQMPRTAASGPDEQVSEMVRDPVCGMYISGDTALSAIKDGRRFHFCSTECHQKFLSGKA
jgi:YHS domain-containing protein